MTTREHQESMGEESAPQKPDIRPPFSYPDPESYFDHLMLQEFGAMFKTHEGIAHYLISKHREESLAVLGHLRKMIDVFDRESSWMLKKQGARSQYLVLKGMLELLKDEYIGILMLSKRIGTEKVRTIDITPAEACIRQIQILATYCISNPSKINSDAQLGLFRLGLHSIMRVFQQAETSFDEGLSSRSNRANRGRQVGTAEQRLLQVSAADGVSDRQLVELLHDANFSNPTTSAGHERSAKSYGVKAEKRREWERLRKARQRMKKRSD